jgi:hypothetical protein
MNPSADPARSEGLLPADSADPPPEVAEEVSLDLQSDSTRQVGAAPPASAPGNPAEALADTLQKDAGDDAGDEQLKHAVERAIPPSV